MNNKPVSIFLVFLFFTTLSFAQDLGTETVEVIKPYTPSVKDATKIRENPAITDSVKLEKKPVKYSIFSFPVASTFTPAKGRATTVERERPTKLYDNYISLGFGTYTSALAEFYTNVEVSRTDNFGIFLTHNSAQGGIDGVELDDQFYDTELNLNYSSYNRNVNWNIDFGAEHQLYNWYGLPNPAVVPDINPQHNFYSVYAGGQVKLDNSFFDKAEARYRYFGDDQNSIEHRLLIKPTVEIPLGGEMFNTNFVFDYLKGSFERNNYFGNEGIDYGFLNAGIETGLVILRDDVTLNLGAAIFYSLDTEESKSSVFIYPQITASYRLAGDYFIAYAGVEGGLRQNSYYQLAKANPFVAPSLRIKPTDEQFDAFLGAKGKLTNSIGYNLKASYKTEDSKPLFIINPTTATPGSLDYAYGNSFAVVYDLVNTVSAFGELNIDVRRNLNLRLNATYNVYDTDKQKKAWNLPEYEANLMADWQITSKWFAGVNLFLVGERKAVIHPNVQNEDIYNNATPQPTNFGSYNLDAYTDLNANVGYRFNDQLSIFAKGYNLLGDDYEKWQNYKVLGLQVMAGATYKFNYGR